MALTEERKAYLAEWRAKNRERIRESQNKYYRANKEVCDDRVKKSRSNKREYYTDQTVAWQVANRERYLQNRRNWYARNSAKIIERHRRRVGKIRQYSNWNTLAEQAEIQGMYDFCRIFKGFEVDHIIPLNGEIVSGLHVLSNLQILSRSENRSKGAKFEEAV